MAQDKANQTNIDKSNLAAYPDAQIKDNDGTSDGTPVARITMSDQFEFFAKLMRMAGLVFNNQYDNETNGFQYIQALQAIAGKNDLVQPVTAGTATIGGTSTPILILANVKIETLLVGEILVGQAAADYASQTNIKGSTAGSYKTVTSTAYKANDYLLIVNGSGGITIQTIATTSSLNVLVAANNYLKAASNADTQAGTRADVAVTPASFLFAFTEFVTDPTAAIPYLATDSTPGLLSATDKTAIDHSLNTKNVGWIAGVDPGGNAVGSTLATSGDITACVTVTGGTPVESIYTVSFANTMASTNYYVRLFVETQGNIQFDNDALCPVFKPKDTGSFTLSIGENNSASGAVTQSLKIHIEVVQIP